MPGRVAGFRHTVDRLTDRTGRCRGGKALRKRAQSQSGKHNPNSHVQLGFRHQSPGGAELQGVASKREAERGQREEESAPLRLLQGLNRSGFPP